MDTHAKWKLIQRHITGRSSPQDRRELKQWMDRDPANEQLVRDAKRIWKLTPEEDFELSVQDAWERFSHRKERAKDAFTPVHTGQKRLGKASYFFQAAAVILVMLLAGLFVRYYTEANKDAETTARFYVMQDLVTEKGEKAKVTFSDGTEVVLNAASVLRFPKKFHGSKREVHLDGEAYFKVASDPRHPFIVHAGDARVHVLGTEFNVRGWSEDAHVDVAVREGKVSVNSSGASQDSAEVVLVKDQFTRVKRGEGPDPVRYIDTEDYLLWTNGGLHFDNTPFEQVVRDIERKFDIQVMVTDRALMNVPFTGTFRNAELQEVLQVIAASMEMEFSHKGSQVNFY